MEVGAQETAFILHHLRIALAAETERLGTLEEGSDEHIELANDLMRLEAIIAKYADRPRLVR